MVFSGIVAHLSVFVPAVNNNFELTNLASFVRFQLRKVVENKYGCRVVQVALEELCAAPDGKHELKKLLTALLNDCDRFVSNEFANYVMQHIIVTDSLAEEREYIIEQCIR